MQQHGLRDTDNTTPGNTTRLNSDLEQNDLLKSADFYEVVRASMSDNARGTFPMDT